MSQREAEDAEIDEGARRFYFRADIDKANLTPPAEHADWFKLVDVDLENCGDGDWDTGDHVGVVTPWQYPMTATPTLTRVDVERALSAVAKAASVIDPIHCRDVQGSPDFTGMARVSVPAAIDCLNMTLGRIEHRLNCFEQRNDTALAIPDLVGRKSLERAFVGK